MYRYCITLAVLLAASSGIRVGPEFRVAEKTDYNAFTDSILDELPRDYQEWLTAPPLYLEITQTTPKDPIGNFSGPNSEIGDVKLAKRTSPVEYSLTHGNLTLATVFSFGQLKVAYPDSTFSFFGQNFEIAVEAEANKNQFAIKFTVYSKVDGSCALDLVDARFASISDIDLQFVSQGFFNQLNLDAKFNHLIKKFLDKFNSILNLKNLTASLQRIICSKLSS